MVERARFLRVVARRVAALVVAVLVLGGAPAQEPAGAGADPAARIAELADRGRAERRAGRLDDALQSFARAAVIAEDAGDLHSVVVLLSLSARTRVMQGRDDAAVECYRDALARLARMPADHPAAAELQARVHTDLSRSLLRSGSPHEAVQQARLAVRLADGLPDPAAASFAWDALGGALIAVGPLAEAPDCFRRALARVPTGAGVARAQLQTNLAWALSLVGQDLEADRLLSALVDELAAAAAPQPALEWRTRSLRATMRFYADWDGAAGDLERALAALDAAGVPEESLPRLQTELMRQFVVRNQGQPRVAAARERELLATLERVAGPDDLLTLAARRFLAGSLWHVGRDGGQRAALDEARRLYEDVAERYRRLRPADAFTAYGSLGRLVLDQFDDPAAAEPWLEAAVAEIEGGAVEARTLDEAARWNMARRWRQFGPDDPYEDLLRCRVRLGRPDAALQVLEAGRARVLADLLQRSRFDAEAEALRRAEDAGDTAVAAALRALPGATDRALAELAAARTRAPADAARTAAIDAAFATLRDLRRRRAELCSSVTAPAAIAEPAAIRRALDPDEALLAYFVGDVESFACLVEGPGGALDWVPLREEDGTPLTAASVDAVVDGVRASMRLPAAVAGRGRELDGPGTGMGAAAAETAAHRAFRLLAPPKVWDRVRDRAHLHVLPHGALHRLPFEALVVSPRQGDSPARRWIDEGPAVALHASGSALVWSRERRAEQARRPAATEALLVGDPDYAAPVATDGAAGVALARVRGGGAGARAGLRAGDVVVSCGGTAVLEVDELERALAAWRAAGQATPLALGVVRGAARRTVALEHGEPRLEFGAAPASPAAGAAPLPRLDGAAGEVAAAAAALRARASARGIADPVVRVFTGADATETLLTAWAPRAAIVHIAAHQVRDEFDRWQAGRIALTPPAVPCAEDDGHLDLDDLLLHWRQRLERCELVVLSSCDSRSGALDRDEGFFALPMGLRFAGCPTVIASLWPVRDDAAAALMTAFYRRLAEPGRSRLDAFTAARRAVRAEFPDPVDWAAFVWIGAPR